MTRPPVASVTVRVALPTTDDAPAALAHPISGLTLVEVQLMRRLRRHIL